MWFVHKTSTLSCLLGPSSCYLHPDQAFKSHLLPSLPTLSSCNLFPWRKSGLFLLPESTVQIRTSCIYHPSHSSATFYWRESQKTVTFTDHCYGSLLNLRAVTDSSSACNLIKIHIQRSEYFFDDISISFSNFLKDIEKFRFFWATFLYLVQYLSLSRSLAI